MKLNSRKKALMIILAATLASTGCGNSYKKHAIEEINEIMDDSVFYQDSYASEENKEFYGKFYETYLNNFVNYMSKSQYKDFKLLVEGVEELEDHDYKTITERLTKILTEENQDGYGFYYAFNATLVYEELFPSYECNVPVFKNVNTIKSIINDDESFYKALFSKDINKMVDLIVEKSGFGLRNDVYEMMICFDEYLKAGNTKEYKEKLLEEISETMRAIVQNKIINDPEYAECFYARMLKKSAYYLENEVSIIHPLLNKDPKLTLELEGRGSLTFEFPSKYFYSNDTELWELKYIVANNKIKESFETESSDALELISLILSPNCTLENAHNEEEIRCELYNDLSSYFNSSDEFVEFLLGLFSSTKYSQEKYFEIFKSRIAENGVEVRDFLNYQCLVNLYYRHELGHYISESDGVDTHKISQMPAEEAEKYGKFYRENYFLGSVDCQKEFEIIENILKNNNLGFEIALNSGASSAWWEKPIAIKDDFLLQVYSAPVEVKTTTQDGITIKYFEAPNGFENGYLAEVYKTLSGETIAKQVSGIDTTIIDESTGEEKKIIIVSINNNSSVPKNVRFANILSLFQKNYKAPEVNDQKILKYSN